MRHFQSQGVALLCLSQCSFYTYRLNVLEVLSNSVLEIRSEHAEDQECFPRNVVGYRFDRQKPKSLSVPLLELKRTRITVNRQPSPPRSMDSVSIGGCGHVFDLIEAASDDPRALMVQIPVIVLLGHSQMMRRTEAPRLSFGRQKIALRLNCASQAHDGNFHHRTNELRPISRFMECWIYQIDIDSGQAILLSCFDCHKQCCLLLTRLRYKCLWAVSFIHTKWSRGVLKYLQ